MRENAIDRAFRSGNPEAKDVGYWAFRSATSHADRPVNRSEHQRWLNQNLDAAIRRFEPKETVARSEEPKPEPAISLEQAQAKAWVLKASL